MDNLVKWIVLGVLCVLKLLITGFVLIIGFRLGGIFFDKNYERFQKATKKEIPVIA